MRLETQKQKITEEKELKATDKAALKKAEAVARTVVEAGMDA